MKWYKNSVLQSSSIESSVIKDITDGLGLEKYFFLHQIVHNVFPFINRQNKFEGVIKGENFKVFGERIILGFFLPFVATVKGNVRKNKNGSEIDLRGSYTFFGKYFVSINVVISIGLIIRTMISGQFNELPIALLLILNSVIGYKIIPKWAEWNFKRVENKIQEIITEHNTAYTQCSHRATMTDDNSWLLKQPKNNLNLPINIYQGNPHCA